MELDLRTLQTFHRMTEKGAATAASRLSDVSHVDAEVERTKIQFVTRDDLADALGDDTYVAVRTNLAGGPGGLTMMMFDSSAAAELGSSVQNAADVDVEAKSVDPADVGSLDDLTKSAVTELSTMMNCGFVDGWANVLETKIDIQPPKYATGSSVTDVFGSLDMVERDDTLMLAFMSRITLDTGHTFWHYLLPDIDSLSETLREDREIVDGFRYEKIIGFDQMVEAGAQQASEDMSQLTGVDTTVDVRNLTFIPVQDIAQSLEGEDVVGVAFTYEGLPSGYLLFVFTEESAEKIIRELLPTDPDDPFNDAGRSALQELGNILASGVLDGWANVLDTAITHTPPEYIHDVGDSILRSIAQKVGENQDYAFVFDTDISAADRDWDCSIYSICDEGDLERALSQLPMDRLHVAREDVSFDDAISSEDGETSEDTNTTG